MSSTAVTRCLAAAERYRDNRTACEKIDARDYQAITDDDLRRCMIMTPAEWREREKFCWQVLILACAERQRATLH